MKTSKMLALALVCLALPMSARSAAAADRSDAAVHATESVVTPTRLTQDMRRLWSEHVIWTREYIVAALDGQPAASAAATRLMKNQEDIGQAVAGFYGDAAGQQLTVLLKEHITVAVDLIAAVKAGNTAGHQAADAAWQRNAHDIADFLSKANPNWPKAALAEMMKGHLSTTTAMVVARLNKNWDADARAFDEVYAHILHMADALAGGIVKQFPGRFATAD